MLIALAYILLITGVRALQAVPFLFASHKLVPKLKDEIYQPNTKIQDAVMVTNMVKKSVTECSSDVYILINVPQLTNADMLESKKHEWRHLQKYLHMASSVVGLPWVRSPLDLEFLEEYIVRTCKAESIRGVETEDDVQDYIDIRKRVIRINPKELPTAGPGRNTALTEIDDLIRKVLRKTPSPHYTIIITSDTPSVVHPIPDIAISEMPDLFEIFHDVVNDPRRETELERNSYLYKDVEPFWNNAPDPTELYLQKKRKDEIHLFDAEFWQKNEKLVATVALMMASLVFLQVLNIIRWLKSIVLNEKPKLE